MAKAKPKKKAPTKDEAIATPKIDRYASRYASWEDFVNEMIPKEIYPTMHQDHLKF